MKTHCITVLPAGYGHWRVQSTFRGKPVCGITTDSELIDKYKSLKDARERGIKTVESALHRIACQSKG